MNFEINNLGIIKDANFDFNDFTIITGNNNSGKTYITETCYGVIKEFKNEFTRRPIKLLKKNLKTLIEEKSITFSIDNYADQINDTINRTLNNFKNNKLSSIFATENLIDNNCEIKFKTPLLLTKRGPFTLMGKTKIKFTDIDEKNIEIKILGDIVDKENFLNENGHTINLLLTILIGENLFPTTHYLCAERNSISKFQIDIDGNRSEIVKEIQNNKKMNINNFLKNNTSNYPLIISDCLANIRDIRNDNNKKNLIINREIKTALDGILEGSFNIDNKKIYFNPKGAPKLHLNLSEASSSVCSLFEFTDFLTKESKNEIIFIDEPEMNLHPINQRKIARLFAIMINLGYKIVISTHSDIIIREINTMILLNNPTKKHILEEEKYSELETLDVKKLNCYTTEQNDDFTYSLKQIPVSQEEGISVESFDKTIEDINRIQDRLLWE